MEKMKKSENSKVVSQSLNQDIGIQTSPIHQINLPFSQELQILHSGKEWY